MLNSADVSGVSEEKLHDKWGRLNSYFPSLCFFFFLSLLVLSATLCGFGALPVGLLYTCSVVLFLRFHLPPHHSYRLTAKLRYENKQLALNLTVEKKSTLPLMLLVKLPFLLPGLVLRPNNIQERQVEI